MAKQTSVLTLEGRVGRLSFYKTKDGYLAREKGGVSRSRIQNDPRFARTRENIREFTDNAKSSKLFRDALRPVISKIGDKRLSQRVTQTMMQVLKADESNVRGDRRVKDGDWTLLNGKELNALSSLGSTLFFELIYVDSPASWLVRIPNFSPQDFVALPSGATHMRLSATGVGLDFDTESRSVQVATSALLSVIEPALTFDLVVDKTQLQGTHWAFVLSVEFVQLVNTVEYSINNGAHNAAKIVAVQKS
ncbi:MAG: hypothetical protein P8O16_00185 [Algoriphagus sp.]|uniref:hypothetical protein n=1 Tax=Algoriphagus sp. TaxID=1872435 RepID=UPI00260567C1|nr:hypothetical protein [Algoriphagus sp.]MDG1275664.1 hypothetical protein [Algoriphagus sp.]